MFFAPLSLLSYFAGRPVLLLYSNSRHLSDFLQRDVFFYIFQKNPITQQKENAIMKREVWIHSKEFNASSKNPARNENRVSSRGDYYE